MGAKTQLQFLQFCLKVKCIMFKYFYYPGLTQRQMVEKSEYCSVLKIAHWLFEQSNQLFSGSANGVSLGWNNLFIQDKWKMSNQQLIYVCNGTEMTILCIKWLYWSLRPGFLLQCFPKQSSQFDSHLACLICIGSVNHPDLRSRTRWPFGYHSSFFLKRILSSDPASINCWHPLEIFEVVCIYATSALHVTVDRFTASHYFEFDRAT